MSRTFLYGRVHTAQNLFAHVHCGTETFALAENYLNITCQYPTCRTQAVFSQVIKIDPIRASIKRLLYLKNVTPHTQCWPSK